MRTKTLACLLTLSIIHFSFDRAFSQEIKSRIPASSLGQKIEQDFGLGTIAVKYYRPNTKGRKIFGNVEPYGVVWRTGANNATVVTVTDTISIEGHTLAPGSYGLFTIPSADEWTIIFSKNPAQWGAYAYDEKQDLFRFKIKPAKLPAKLETLTIQFNDMQLEQGTLQIAWENTALNLHLKADVDRRIMANIQELMKAEKKPYYMAAIWYFNHGKDTKQALAWMQEADKASPNAYNMKYWLARLQLKNGDKASAIANAKETIRLAEAEHNDEYIRLGNEVLKEAGV